MKKEGVRKDQKETTKQRKKGNIRRIQERALKVVKLLLWTIEETGT